MNTDIILPPESLDDENGNCKRCGHPFNPHVIVAYDVNDFSKGGEMRCPVEHCECFATVHFDPLRGLHSSLRNGNDTDLFDSAVERDLESHRMK